MASDPQFESISVTGPPRPPVKQRLKFDTRMTLMALLISLPGVLVAELLLWFGGHSLELKCH